MQEPDTKIEKFIESMMEEFKENVLAICKSIDNQELDYNSAINFTGQIKETVLSVGCRLVKAYFESRDESTDSIELGGKRYLNKGKSHKTLVTSLGKISISRSYYQNRSGGACIFPLDEQLGIKGEYLMADVKEAVLYSCAFNTPEETSKLLEKCGSVKLHSTQIKRVVDATGQFIEKQGIPIMAQVRQSEPVIESDILAVSLDGVNVLLNTKGKKKGRPAERPTGKEAACSSAYKNAMCGSISRYRICRDETGKKPERIGTKYIARMPEERYPTFKREFERELKSALPENEKAIVKLVITDAHKSISGYLKDNPVFADYHHIIDFFHASEHLSLLAEAIHGKSCPQATQWYLKFRDILINEQQGVVKLIRSAEYYLRRQHDNKSKKKEMQKHLEYFKNHKNHMKYAGYIEKGWPIGSGVIEAACKSVVKQRMCRSGQRWSIKGGQAILDIRAVVKSDRWELFWLNFSETYYNKAAA